MIKVLLVGRINVGKSTLFNCLVEEKKSIVSPEPGTTRDRIYGRCFWRGESFQLIDLAGLKGTKVGQDFLTKEVQKQIAFALEEGDLILFLLDGKTGLTAEDRVIAKKLKKLKKPIILVVNKIDSPRQRAEVKEENFLKLGLGQPFFISALNGPGVGDLLDEILKKIKEMKAKKTSTLVCEREKEKSLKAAIKIAIIGRPNVGKSTLVNSILGEERVIVTPFPQTTREPVDTFFTYKDKLLIFIDTAGIRRRTKIKKEIERIGIERSLKTIQKADLVLLVFDLNERVSHLERTLARLIKEEKKSLILVVNKFDLAKLAMEKYLEYYQSELETLWWAPIIFVSAKEKINLTKLLDLILEIEKRKKKKFSPKILNQILKETIREYHFKEKYWLRTKIFQVKEKIPTIVIKVPRLTRKEKPPVQAQFNLLEKKIREKFNFWGVPLRLESRI
ncbi:MAG: ribosome biogenesis GTPase Der [Patescibacteria group bacterium]|nr:ribosome biogenesis GTPase Der [Patescibacteria group bacterium]